LGKAPSSGGNPAGYFESAVGWAIQAVGHIYAESQTADAATVGGRNKAGGTGVSGVSDEKGGIGVYGRGKQYAAEFEGMVQCNGDIHCSQTVHCDGDIHCSKTVHAIQDVVLGSDCAEDFDVVPSTSTSIEPGTVMVLTDNGALQPSGTAYDKKVAGVLSGAGDYHPGLILGRSRSTGERRPLALVGRVYCKADARYGPIEIGDLLTTSPTEGHAMKANDRERAFGAVIGKALKRLATGTGLIPILIALQ
jgi:hypothetical protein